MLYALALICSVASAIIFVPDNWKDPYATCEPGLVSDTTRFMVASYYDDSNSRRQIIPVEIRQPTGRSIEVYSLNRKPNSKYEASRNIDGDRVYLARQPILRAKGIEWEWVPRTPPNHFGPSAYALWTHYHVALEKLVTQSTVKVEELMRSELHHFWWNDRSAFLLRLPSRDPSMEERYRTMWLFANDAMEPIPIGRAVDSLRLNGESFPINKHRVYRFEDGEGRLRYVFE